MEEQSNDAAVYHPIRLNKNCTAYNTEIRTNAIKYLFLLIELGSICQSPIVIPQQIPIYASKSYAYSLPNIIPKHIEKVNHLKRKRALR